MRDLLGKTAVVTGAASGIGLALANAFERLGMNVVRADIADCDVSDAAAIEALAESTCRRFGAVHVLCNNAGVAVDAAPSWEQPLEAWRRMLDVNLLGVVHGIRSFVPRMIQQGAEAHIVNTASIVGLVATPNAAPYAAGKHAVVAVSESLAMELADRKLPIGVSVLCPAAVATPMMGGVGMKPEDVADQVVEAILESRFYVLTHPYTRILVEQRYQSIREGRPPLPPVWE